ncbi:MAG: uncharacterized membrane protein (DUF485 family) [Psychromonas sp.]|jgi:uncharacterized membrane protein (DUF485 family)
MSSISVAIIGTLLACYFMHHLLNSFQPQGLASRHSCSNRTWSITNEFFWRTK